ncbi:endonuclease-reverse transcriptase [Plakobranchus ocellatus]|uniref:Endonuclease-reverse transcriptase n=1 Tax=Plakobranchus ocellatus TaxID=259542 RepID=A0AAV3YEI1_9GAST|nr:endonuclease-reverse transcriptase [Plakobranchus ocellatus]
MWLIRRMMKIWTERKSNELVLKEANLEQSLIKTIRQRQLQFLGHICLHEGLEHLEISEKIEGKRNRGRQRITFIENLKTWAIGKGSNNNVIRLTADSKRGRFEIALEASESSDTKASEAIDLSDIEAPEAIESSDIEAPWTPDLSAIETPTTSQI